jgi:acyl carrier protein
MELNKFIENIAIQFEDTDQSEFIAETKFKELEEWSSLMALLVIAMIDNEYHVKVKGDDIRNSNTINDLYEIVRTKV